MPSVREKITDTPRVSEIIKATWKPFRDKEAELKGAPGKALTGMPEEVNGIEFVRYDHGVIYNRPDGRCVWVYGAINDHYQQMKGPQSWLGLPTIEETDLGDKEGGRVSVFDNGQIYWWKDVGPIDLNDVLVKYAGLVCHETSSGPGSDEPYLVTGVAVPRTARETEAPVHTVVSQIYEEVDANDWRDDAVELYRGKPRGIVLNFLLMENDEGDPNKYRDAMQAATKAGAGAVSGALGATFPVLIPILAAASPLIAKAAQEIGEVFNSLLGTGDDEMGRMQVPLTAKQLVMLAARTPKKPGGITWKMEVGRFTGDDANYAIFLDFDPV